MAKLISVAGAPGSGSTTEQYLCNRDKALGNLKAALPELFEEL